MISNGEEGEVRRRGQKQKTAFCKHGIHDAKKWQRALSTINGAHLSVNHIPLPPPLDFFPEEEEADLGPPLVEALDLLRESPREEDLREAEEQVRCVEEEDVLP